MVKRILAFALLGSCFQLSSEAEKAPRPNIVFILADDLGWGDLSCYGGSLRTPNLDRLAQSGTLFTQFYANSSVCSPSRVAFFTSQFPARHKVHGHFTTASVHGAAAAAEKNTRRGMVQFLDPKVPNVAATLRKAGYTTAHIGKWHLSDPPGGPSIADYGFDFVGSGHDPTAAARDDPYYRARSTTQFVDEALGFIEDCGEKPFYLQLWTLLPHAYLHPTPEQLQPYTRLLSPQRPYLGAFAIYHASITDLDTQIGRLIDELDKRGRADNTVIIFTSDHGPDSIYASAATHSGVGSPGPFRGRKLSLYEGGVRVPFIARWPNKIPAGRIDDTSVIAGVDFLPTVCNLAGVPMPLRHDADGEDMSDILFGRSHPRINPLLWEWRFNVHGHLWNRSPQLAIRDGDWKLLINPDGSRAELYNIPRDPSELDNLAESQPAIAARLSERVLAWHKELPAGPVSSGAGRNDYPWPVAGPAVATGND